MQRSDEPPERRPKEPSVAEAVDWDEILKTFNVWYDRLTAAEGKATFAQRREAHAAIAKDLEQLRSNASLGASRGAKMFLAALLQSPSERRAEYSKSLGNLLMTILLPSLHKAGVLRDQAAMDFELARLAFALAAYKADKGQYPPDLASLAKEYVREVPADLFTGKPLIYKPDGGGYLLYSVGPDGKDDGGKRFGPESRGWEDFDIVVEVK